MSRPQVTVVSLSGVTYDEPRTGSVWIAHTNTWARPSDPIFHRIGPWQRTTPKAEGSLERLGWCVETTCGALVSSASWLREPGTYKDSDYRHSDTGLQIPIRWALQFARPCRRCWP